MMMDDMALDRLLTQWKTDRAPGAKTFTSKINFERRFFARVSAEKSKHDRKKTLKDFVDLISKITPEAALIRRRLAQNGLMARPSMSIAACAPPLHAMRLAPAEGKLYMHDIGRLELSPTQSNPRFDTDEYKSVGDRPFVATATKPLSTSLVKRKARSIRLSIKSTFWSESCS